MAPSVQSVRSAPLTSRFPVRAAGTFHGIFYHYLEIQTWPGIFLTNMPLVAQLSLQIGAAIIQGRAEMKVRAAEAKEAPPTASRILIVRASASVACTD